MTQKSEALRVGFDGQIRQGGPAATGLDGRVRELEAELRRVERERDILKKAISIFGRDG